MAGLKNRVFNLLGYISFFKEDNMDLTFAADKFCELASDFIQKASIFSPKVENIIENYERVYRDYNFPEIKYAKLMLKFLDEFKDYIQMTLAIAKQYNDPKYQETKFFTKRALLNRHYALSKEIERFANFTVSISATLNDLYGSETLNQLDRNPAFSFHTNLDNRLKENRGYRTLSNGTKIKI